VTIVENERDGYVISTDKTKLDVGMICTFLSETSYWAKGRALDVIARSIDNSLCFGVYKDGRQIGFARAVTDCATFAWLCDVFILDAHRGQGLGKWLVESVVAHPDLQGVLFFLGTRDAHELYRRYGGFRSVEGSERWMFRPREGAGSAQQG
jgi:GNAT superfamily N-acetyltransferase